MILPALEVCEHCSKPESDHGKVNHKYELNKVLPRWYGWHAFRRGLATNLNRLGVDDSVIQRILRHSHVAVTQACYIKTASEDAKAAMQKLEIALNDPYVTPRPRHRQQVGNVMTRPDTMQISLLDGFRRILAEREGFEPSVQVLARTTV